jgi:hypothetical protein
LCPKGIALLQIAPNSDGKSRICKIFRIFGSLERHFRAKKRALNGISGHKRASNGISGGWQGKNSSAFEQLSLRSEAK